MQEQAPASQPIRTLQRMLWTISCYDQDVLPVSQNSAYTSELIASVASFQKKNTLSVTGVVDHMTWNAINAAYHQTLEEFAQTGPHVQP